MDTQARIGVASLVATIAGVLVAIIALPQFSSSNGGSSVNTPLGVPASSSMLAPATTETDTAPASTIETAQPQTRFLSDMTSFGGTGWDSVGPENINGQTYAHSVSIQVKGPCGPPIMPDSVEYELGRKWRTFTTTIGLSDDSLSGVKVQIEVFVDGVLRAGSVMGVNADKKVVLDVAGAGRLKLEETYIGGTPNNCFVAKAVWGDAELTK